MYLFSYEPLDYQMEQQISDGGGQSINISEFFLLIYLWLHWVFIALCGLSLVAVNRGYSSLQRASFSLRWLLLLGSGRGLQDLQHVGSVVVTCGLHVVGSVVVVNRLSGSMACGIFPSQGLNPCPLHWQLDSYPLRHQGSP